MKDLTQELVRELLHYNPETGVFTWRERDRKWFKNENSFKGWNTRYAGARAGNVYANKRGYSDIRISILAIDYLAHRLAFIYMTGSAPEQVDHINRDATDNRWENMRPSTSVANARNKSMNAANTSGVSGVCWSKSVNKWVARVGENCKNTYLGAFDNIEDAAERVRSFRIAKGYDDEHGKEMAHYRKK